MRTSDNIRKEAVDMRQEGFSLQFIADSLTAKHSRYFSRERVRQILMREMKK